MATLYKVKTNRPVDVDGKAKTPVVWAASEGAARKARKELAEKHGLKPLKDVDYEQVEVPTSKAGILEWLNANVTSET